jgi:UDP-3-O-[3-hydroxymyristoyl] glucosamine N-acyltransferase
MSKTLFFKNKGPFKLHKIFPKIKVAKDVSINNIKNIFEATNQDITFLDSRNYLEISKKTKAKACITTKKLAQYLPDQCILILTDKVLFEVAKVAKLFYPEADIDYLDKTLKKPINKNYPSVNFGNNVLVGKGVKIGKKSQVGNNTIIESNVYIGKNCIIGSGVHLKNSVLGDNVVIQSGCKIGLKGFGFIPIQNQNFKFPHIGSVQIGSNVEIAANCTIDRGSLDHTVIGDNTYLDNQVHVAHNVKIGKNCMIAGQVGFAGSTKVGNNVSIGGQAGISGHLTIGNNVKIGGGSGVIKDIEDNSVVMGYPAINFKEFIKSWRK